MNKSQIVNEEQTILEHFSSLENVYYAYKSVFRISTNESVEKRHQRSLAANHALSQISEFDAMFYSAIASYLLTLDKTDLRNISLEVGIKIHDKQLKRLDWKPYVVEKLLFRALKPFVRVLLDKFLVYSSKALIESVERQHGTITSFIEHLNDENADWIKWMKENSKDTVENRMYGAALNKIAMYQACLLTKKVDIATELRLNFSQFDQSIYDLEILQGYYYHRGAKEQLDGGTSNVSFIEALQQAKVFEEKYEIEKIQSEDLNRKLEYINRTSEEQLTEALELVKVIEEENENLKTEIEIQNELIQQYQAVIKRMSNQLLAGKHVLVIGHKAQRTMYNREISERGGICEFFDADAGGGTITRLLKGALSRADLIIHVTSFANHMISDYLKSNQIKSSDHYVPCGVSGRDSFTRKLDEFLVSKQSDKAFNLSRG
jgi:hypothetical protein